MCGPILVQVCFVHVCFVQVTSLKIVWRSRGAGAPRCAHFPTDICSVIQEGVLTVEKCAHRGKSVGREPHTMSLGQNKHGHNNSAPVRIALYNRLFARSLNFARANKPYAMG